jgi:hypothetical protein
VVLDASWLDPAQRDAARALARDTRSALHEICCLLDVREAEERIRARAAHGADPSDATPEVLAALAERTEVPWQGARAVDTSLDRSRSVDEAVRLVAGDRIARLAGSDQPMPYPIGRPGPNPG